MDKWIDSFIEIEEISMTRIESVISNCISELDDNPLEEFITAIVVKTIQNDPNCREFTITDSQLEHPILKKDARGKDCKVFVDLIQCFEITDNDAV